MGSSLDDLSAEPPAPVDAAAPAPVDAAPAAPSSLDEAHQPAVVQQTPQQTQAEMDKRHPLFGEEPGAPHRGESAAFWTNFFEEVPGFGKQIDKAGTEDIAIPARMAAAGIPKSGAEEEIQTERAATDREYPGWAAAGKLTSSVGGLAIAAAKFPKLFGLASDAGYKLPALIGGATNAAIKGLDNWMRDKPQDPVELGLTAIAGAGASALATGLNRVFTAAVKPGLDELYKAAVIDHGIPLGAGKISANKFFGKVDGELLAQGETLLANVGAAEKGEAAALDGWHRAITRSIGEPGAPRLTAKLMGDAAKRMADRVAEIKKLPSSPAIIRELQQLNDQAQNLRILQGVTTLDRYGRFTPTQFHDAVVQAVDAQAAQAGGKVYAAGGGGTIAQLADIGAAFLKPTANAKMDWSVAVRLLKQTIYSGGPGAAVHLFTQGLHIPDLTTAAILTAPVAAVKLGANLIGTRIAGAVARSPRIGNALVNEASPLNMAGRFIVKPAVALAKPTLPGLIQQAVPLGDQALTGRTPR